MARTTRLYELRKPLEIAPTEKKIADGVELELRYFIQERGRLWWRQKLHFLFVSALESPLEATEQEQAAAIYQMMKTEMEELGKHIDEYHIMFVPYRGRPIYIFNDENFVGIR